MTKLQIYFFLMPVQKLPWKAQKVHFFYKNIQKEFSTADTH